MILEFSDSDLIFAIEDSASKVTASSRVGKEGYGSEVEDVGVGGVGMLSVGGSD